MTKFIRRLLLSCMLIGYAVIVLPAQAQGTLEKIQVLGPSLVGNLEGDDPERDVYVYLPPSYQQEKSKRFPVIYYLHGYIATAKNYAVDAFKLPGTADAFFANEANQAIIVFPDAYTIYGGSMFSSSPTIGDWETFIAKDLVSYIDKHYRTLAKRESRGLSGHSMGGYGTLRIGMKYPDVFVALYAMSSCCLLNQAPGKEAVAEQVKRMAAGPVAGEKGFGNALQAQAAAWAPNPTNPPYFFDWPVKDGVDQPIVQGKWIANSPVIFVDQYATNLKRYKAIAIEMGDKDPISAPTKDLDAALTRLGIEHAFEVYDGDHINRVGSRFAEKVLPFFAKNLQTK
jgi:S-formylglutathione hydrolase FrmB